MLFDAAVRSIEYFYRKIYWDAPTAETLYQPGFTLTYSGISWLHSINQLWLHQPEALTESVLEEAANFFRPFRAEYSIILTEPNPTANLHWLSEHHYIERAASPFFMLRGMPHPRHWKRELEVIVVGPDRQRELLDALYSTFFMGPEIGRCAVRAEHFDDPTIRHYLGYLNGEVAACATVLLGEGIAGLWNVGTLRPFRGQGVASALLSQILAEATVDGYPDSVLVASPMGRPLYEEMGYRFLGNSYFYGPLE